MNLAFHRDLKKLILRAFSGEQFQPEQIAQSLIKAQRRPCGKQDAAEFKEWLANRGIQRLVHFTELKNVPYIARYGLIPREYLEQEVVKMALGAGFSDAQRSDGMREYNCLSLTSPNYRMFYKKRTEQKQRRWAVIEFNPEVLTEFFFQFTPTNAASGCLPEAGIKGAENMFELPQLRKTLGLEPPETTDPQAEALCDSILPMRAIKNIFVDNKEDADWLVAHEVAAVIERHWFKPRRDYSYWRGN
ncbi:DarT ssDNA thymidine ADP-ribosyltransferase family protein [Candidatus Marimicrobium litorale]|uniref:DUF4433 domain-containing protein n=1 Tax=Candidatus Marimicrobium litorale TaxID=2518991 RepID=A0ABT3T9X1_9GAMM|nr:DarT ssDNA thymidine ADP-ribosyltransferase family protein [Candidatus Marimicrobium litorale]MCX2979076.1 DUF4433 domain-containing protein [Candidatus Marimicrobium litorale]